MVACTMKGRESASIRVNRLFRYRYSACKFNLVIVAPYTGNGIRAAKPNCPHDKSSMFPCELCALGILRIELN
jgi:hypothetical protein